MEPAKGTLTAHLWQNAGTLQNLFRLVSSIALALFVAGDSYLDARVDAQVSMSVRRVGVHVFLLAGQSNMAGRGRVEDIDRAVHSRVWMFDQNARWVPAIEPMHFDKPIAGVGPGRSFGLAIAESDPTIRVGLIPAAVGGSPVTTWEPGARFPDTGAYPWDDALRRVRAAGSDSDVKAILWHQGESDANPEAAPLYEQRLRALITRFRTELGNPSLPFLIGQLGRFEGRPWTVPFIEVDAAHRRIAADVPNVVFVSSEALQDNGDNLHFSAEAARAFGRRYADAYLKLVAR